MATILKPETRVETHNPFQIWWSKHGLTAVRIFMVLWVALWLVAQFELGGSEAGADGRLWRDGASKACQYLPTYPQGAWQLANPELPRMHWRWSFVLAEGVGCLSSEWAYLEIGLLAALIGFLLLMLPAWFRAFKLNGFTVKNFPWVEFLFIGSSFTLGSIGYLNIEVILLLAVGVTFWKLAEEKWITVGLMIALFALTKPHFIFVLAYMIPAIFSSVKFSKANINQFFQKINWKQVRGLAIVLLVALGAYIVANALAVIKSGNPQYAIHEIFDQYRYLANTLKDMPFYPPESRLAIQDNGIIALTISRLGYGAMQSSLAGYSLSTWVVVLSMAIVVANGLHQTYFVIRYKTDKTAWVVYGLLAWYSVMLIQPQLEYVNLAPVIAAIFFFSPEMSKQMRALGLLIMPYILMFAAYAIYMATGIEFFDWISSPLVTLTAIAAIVLCDVYILWRIQWVRQHPVAQEPTTMESTPAVAGPALGKV